MAFDDAPTNVITNWSEDGTDITIPIADLDELTAAEADATTGDLRKCWYALCMQFKTYFDALATADKPTQLLFTSSDSLISGEAGNLRRRFVFEFDIGGDLDVVDE